METFPEASSWPRVSICRPQSPILLPGQVQLALVERGAGRTSRHPVLTLILTPSQGQKTYGAMLSFLRPLVKCLAAGLKVTFFSDLPLWSVSQLTHFCPLPSLLAFSEMICKSPFTLGSVGDGSVGCDTSVWPSHRLGSLWKLETPLARLPSPNSAVPSLRTDVRVSGASSPSLAQLLLRPQGVKPHHCGNDGRGGSDVGLIPS